MSPSTLGAWESERKTPSIESLEAMADLYQVTTDYLLGRGDANTATSLPLPEELLKIYHGKSIWSSDYGWVLVDSVRNVLGNHSEVWLEPISHDADLREELRGWYRVCERWVENDYGTRFPIDTYGAKWLAFILK